MLKREMMCGCSWNIDREGSVKCYVVFIYSMVGNEMSELASILEPI